MGRYVDLNNDDVVYCGMDGEYDKYNIPSDAVEKVIPLRDIIKYRDEMITAKQKKPKDEDIQKSLEIKIATFNWLIELYQE